MSLPGSSLSLRPARADDVPALAALEQDAFGVDAWSAAMLAAELTGPGRRALVALDEADAPDGSKAGGLVGFAVTWSTGEVADLQRVVVAEQARRRGVATTLLRALLQTERADGVRRVLLEVSERNVEALACYRALGFDQIDRRPRYYRDGAAAVVLQRELAAPETRRTP